MVDKESAVRGHGTERIQAWKDGTGDEEESKDPAACNHVDG